jgi:parallel beta-helix repeat protein
LPTTEAGSKEGKEVRMRLRAIPKLRDACLLALLFPLFVVAAWPNRAATATHPASLQVVGQAGGAIRTVALQDGYAYVGVGLCLEVVDVSDPADPQVIARTSPFGHSVEDIAVSGTHAYVAAGGAGLRVVDLSNAEQPVEVGYWESPGYAEGVTISDGTAYLADGPYGLRVIDVSDPQHPAEMGFAYETNYAFEVVVIDEAAYIAAAGAGLLVADVSDPENPVALGSLDTPGYAYGVDVVGDTAYVADGWAGLHIMNVAVLAQPTSVGSFKTLGWVLDVDISNDTAFIADAVEGISIIDVSDPANPVELGGESFYTADRPSLVTSLTVRGSVAYAVDYSQGLQLLDVSNPAQPANIGTLSPMGYGDDVVTSGDYAYVAAGPYGLQVVDVSSPDNPQELGSLVTPNAQCVDAAGDYAVGGTCSGIYVVDVSNPNSPSLGSVFNPDGRMGCVQDVVLSEGIAYVVDELGLWLVDLSNPLAPTEMFFMDFQGEAHHCTWGVDVVGHTAYVAQQDEGLHIVDVSDPYKPLLRGTYSSPTMESANEVVVEGGFAYVLDVGHLEVVDISNPDQPLGKGHCYICGIGDRIEFADGIIYATVGAAGLCPVDVSDVENPTPGLLVRLPGYAMGVTVTSGHIYVAGGNAGLFVLERTGELSSARETPDRGRPIASAPGEDITPAERLRPNYPTGRLQVEFQPAAFDSIRSSSTVATRVVTSTADNGPGTFRWHLENAVSDDTIVFDDSIFPPASPATITLDTQLPDLSQGGLTIDASSAGVVLDGSGLAEGSEGLSITSDGNVVRGLQILHFPENGVSIRNGAYNTIGGDRGLGSGPTGQANLISGNGYSEVRIGGEDSTHNRIIGNLIGTDASGTALVSSAHISVFVTDGSYNTIGGTRPQDRNTILGNDKSMVGLINTHLNTVVGNYIGTDITGQVSLGDPHHAVSIELAAYNNFVEENLINGEVVIQDWGSWCNQVVGNYIGTDPTGSVPVSDRETYVSIGARFNKVGGTAPEERNVIAGGLWISRFGVSDALVLGNYIGIGESGGGAFGQSARIFLSNGTRHSFIGGTTDAERNIISGIEETAVLLEGVGVEYNFLAGNYIGTDATGSLAVPNQNGVALNQAENNVIQANLVSGNLGRGVSLEDSHSNHVRGNRIGIAADGVSPLPNGDSGLRIEGSSNVVGGAQSEDGNTIAFNSGDGVQVETYPGNTIRRNSIYSNKGSGINLGGGGNNNMPAPIITSVTISGAAGTACPGCIVELFSDEEDEGQVYEGGAVADGSGKWSWTGSLTGPYVTATATDEAGNTSPFSAPQMSGQHSVYLPLILRE